MTLVVKNIRKRILDSRLSLTCFFLVSMSVPCTAATFMAFFLSMDIMFFFGGLVVLRPPPCKGVCAWLLAGEFLVLCKGLGKALLHASSALGLAHLHGLGQGGLGTAVLGEALQRVCRHRYLNIYCGGIRTRDKRQKDARREALEKAQRMLFGARLGPAFSQGGGLVGRK